MSPERPRSDREIRKCQAEALLKTSGGPRPHLALGMGEESRWHCPDGRTLMAAHSCPLAPMVAHRWPLQTLPLLLPGLGSVLLERPRGRAGCHAAACLCLLRAAAGLLIALCRNHSGSAGTMSGRLNPGTVGQEIGEISRLEASAALRLPRVAYRGRGGGVSSTQWHPGQSPCGQRQLGLACSKEEPNLPGAK